MHHTLKYQMGGSKIGKICHFSTSHETCLRICHYCYNHKSLTRFPAVADTYQKNTLCIMNRERLPYLPESRSMCRISLNGDFSFKNISDSKYYISEWIRLAKHHNGIAGHLVLFFGYTKSWQDKNLLPLLKKLNKLPNVSIRCSVDATTGVRIPKGFKKAGISYKLPHDKPLKGQFICQYNNVQHRLYRVKCDKCKICINKKTKVDVYFPVH